MPFSLSELQSAAELVHRTLAETPQIGWRLLSERCGCEVWVKHENHTPIGSFKVRGGLVYMESLRSAGGTAPDVVAATRGNHGQSVAFAARSLGARATIVVPRGNSVEKNRAMRGFGAELVEHGHDFNAAFEHAEQIARERRLHLFPSFHPLLVKGVASYSLELLRGVPDLDLVYVPIGLGSGICGMLAARDALGLTTRVIGVVSTEAPTYALSFKARQPVATNSCDTLADGIAVRIPDERALELILRGVERIVSVSDDEVLAAMRHYFSDTHNVAEGAGAAPLAALLKERHRVHGKRVGLVLSGGNVLRKGVGALIPSPKRNEATQRERGRSP